MKKLLLILFAFIGSFSFSQEYDFQEMCLACAAADGYYCGDDPTNWTQYAPMGCVQSSWINDGWEDCVDASDENGAVPTSPEDCAPPPQECDTVYVEIPVVEYEYIYETDTIVEFETVIETEYVYITDTVTIYEDVLDTMFIDVIEYVEVIVNDTIVEYVEVVIAEYVDCETGMPCNTGMMEILDKSIGNDLIYDLNGRILRKPEGIYIEGGKIKYILN